MTLARKMLAVAALGLATGLAHAGNINWSVGINLPPVGTVISNAPVYAQPAPYYHQVEVPYYAAPAVVYRPAPVYYSPPALVYRRVPIYAGEPEYVIDHRGPRHRQWEHRGYDGHHGHHGHHGQYDRRGGRYDRD